MGPLKIQPGNPLRGVVHVPGDKSISHRALMFNAMAEGTARITGLLRSQDVLSTAHCLRELGVVLEWEGANDALVKGCGGRLQIPKKTLDCGNSGTTMRLLAGLLAGQDFPSILDGDGSLRGRPMARVMQPLARMGARFDQMVPPIAIHGSSSLQGIKHESPVASAQVKSALLLAGIQGAGTTTVMEPSLSRDHTERMFSSMGVFVQSTLDEHGAHTVQVKGQQTLQSKNLSVPGDLSSAAFLVVGATICRGSELVLPNVGINPTRMGLIDVLQRMGADIEIEPSKTDGAEPTATIRVRHSELCGVEIEGREVVRLIDEVPVLCVAAACAEGPTTIRDASELRCKESDRIRSVVNMLRRLGAEVEEMRDGMRIIGKQNCLIGGQLQSMGDHRVALSAAVAGLVADGGVEVLGHECIDVSFPGFGNCLSQARRGS